MWSGHLTQQTLCLFKRILNLTAETTLKATELFCLSYNFSRVLYSKMAYASYCSNFTLKNLRHDFT